MKILFVTNDMMHGGSGWLMVDAARHLLTLGHAVMIDKPGRDHHATSAELRGRGLLENYRVVPTRWPIRMLRKLDRRPHAEKVLNLFKPDIVVFNQLLQSNDFEWFSSLQKRNLPYATLCHLVLDDLSRPDELIDQIALFYRNARLTCFVAKRSLELFELQIGSRLKNARIVANPVRVPLHSAPPWPPSKTLNLAVVARLDPDNKGQDILMETLALPIWRERDFCLNLFGKGGAEQGLRRAAAMLGIEAKVRFHGYCNDVHSIWMDQHVCALPSRQESMPIAMIEAMLMGRPVLATDVAGMPEVVEDDVSGFIAAACTPTALGAALERLWNNRHRLEEMGCAAQRHARSIVPADPGRDFAELILQTASSP